MGAYGEGRRLADLAKQSEQNDQRFAAEQQDQRIKQMKMITQLAEGVTDQDTYSKALETAGQWGLDTSTMPKEYDPNLLNRYKTLAQTELERVTPKVNEMKANADVINAEANLTRAKAWATGTPFKGGKGGKSGKEPAGPESSEPAKMTEIQSKALGFGRRAMLADQMINQIEANPNVNVSSLKTQAMLALPKWMGGVRDPREQALATAKLSFIASVLRKESGAAVTPEEFGQYDKMYFPQPGDTPETRADKATLRANFVDTEKLTAGKAWRAPIPLSASSAGAPSPSGTPLPRGTPPPAPAATPPPKHGAVEEGFVFMGGDPGDERNWKRK